MSEGFLEQDFLNTYEPMCNTLCNLGWFVAPYLLQSEYVELKVLCRSIDNETSLDTQKKSDYINKIDKLLGETVFHPNYRAFFIYRSKEVPHVSEYSHLYERGIYHYYKSDYTSSILTMLPGIEGALLSYYGWSFGQGVRKPGQGRFLEKLRNETINSGNSDVDRLFSIYGRVLAEFLERWLFSDTDTADFSASWLNRHVLMHGMTPVNINRQSDVNRIIIFFDLLISYLSIPLHKWYTFIPVDKKEIMIRRDYLFTLLSREIPVGQCIEIEDRFLRENKNYVPPD